MPEFLQSLAMVAEAMAEAREPWWVIGSAAASLHGAPGVRPRDIDIVLSVADARRILPGLGVALTPGKPDERFRSDFYCCWRAPPVPVDFMAGFHFRQVLLRPRSREDAGAAPGIFIPARDELLAMLLDFGRPKDLERARLLAATSCPANP